MLCNQCGTQMPEDSRYCRICGTPLVRSSVYPPAVAEPRPDASQEIGGFQPLSETQPEPTARSPLALPARDLAPYSSQRRGERRKRRRHRKWYQKVLIGLNGSLGDGLKILGLALTVVVLYLLLRLAR